MTPDTLTRASWSGILLPERFLASPYRCPVKSSFTHFSIFLRGEAQILGDPLRGIEVIPFQSPFHATNPRQLYAPAHNQIHTLPSWMHDSRVTRDGKVSLVDNESGLYECDLSELEAIFDSMKLA
jgi:hypothetical protein